MAVGLPIRKRKTYLALSTRLPGGVHHWRSASAYVFRADFDFLTFVLASERLCMENSAHQFPLRRHR